MNHLRCLQGTKLLYDPYSQSSNIPRLKETSLSYLNLVNSDIVNDNLTAILLKMVVGCSTERPQTMAGRRRGHWVLIKNVEVDLNKVWSEVVNILKSIKTSTLKS